MSTDKKRLSSESPRKVQTEMTSFTGERIDNKASPARSYAQVASNNRFEALSDPENEDDEMQNAAQSSDSSDTTPKQVNAKALSISTKEKYQNPLSKKSQRKIAKAAKKDVRKVSRTNQPLLLSSATKVTLERARKAKELLQIASTSTEDKDDTYESTPQREKNNSEMSHKEDLEVSSRPGSNELSTVPKPSSTDDASDSLLSQDRQVNTISEEPSAATSNSSEHQKARIAVNNPYQKRKSNPQGVLHAIPQGQTTSQKVPGSIDKHITLKKGILRPHIHRYTLRIKIISSKNEEDEQALVQKTLKKFFDIVLQGDPKSIIPPYFELDRSDKSVPDLSSSFNVEALDSYYSLKRYFSRLSPRSDDGHVWCSIILAQSIAFPAFMEKTRHSLENQAFSLWPKASDHELATDVGWLLYSTRQQDETRIAEMLSQLSGETIGAKWKAIRTTTGSNHSKDKDDSSSRVYALHLECAADCAQEARKKLSKWYGSASKKFPDGSKMRLVPPFNTILSTGNRQTYASLIARQSALNSRLGTGTTWEFSTNLMLDRPEPTTGHSLRDVIMAIPSQVFPGTPLFHTIDKQWRSETGVTFTFLPENDSDARSIIAGLIPFLRHTAPPWYMNMFTTEAKYRHASSKWDQATRQVFSVAEFEIDEFLADDDEYNKTDEPTAERPNRSSQADESYIQVQVPIIIDPEDSLKMYEDDDSVSTFHQMGHPSHASISPSKTFTPKIISNPPSVLDSSVSNSKPTDINYQDEDESVSKLSDTQSRLSTMEQDIKHMHSSFQQTLAELKLQSQQQASKQSLYDATLSEILNLLKQSKVTTSSAEDTLDSSARANTPEQLNPTGGSSGAAGSG
jgi:hypothetical protein